MNLLSRAFLCISATLLTVLVVLRISAPEQVVNQVSGFMLSIGWALMLFLGVAEWKSLSISSASAGKPITLISAFLVGGATDIVLGLGFFSQSESNPILASFLSAVTAIILCAWWKILWKGERK